MLLKAKEDIDAIRGGVLAELIAARADVSCRFLDNLIAFGRLLRRPACRSAPAA